MSRRIHNYRDGNVDAFDRLPVHRLLDSGDRAEHADESGKFMANKFRLAFVEYYLRKFAAEEHRILELVAGWVSTVIVRRHVM
jgi:hypothetical protein